MIYREENEWCDTWIEEATDCHKPRLLLVGDSITRSYYSHVKEKLSQSFACAYLATSKCVADPALLRELDLVLNQYEFSMIHFNNGMHGWDYDEDAYATGLAEAFDKLIAHCGADRVVWGTTTPVWKTDDLQSLHIKTARVIRRNNIAASLTQVYEINTNDLFAAIINQPRAFCPDGVHLRETGQIELANRVTSAIQKQLTQQEQLVCT